MKKMILILTTIGLVYASEITTLSKAVEMGLKNEPSLQSTIYKNLSDSESINQVKAKLYPQVEGNLNYKNRKYTQNYNKKDYSENYKSYSIVASQSLFNAQTYNQITQEEIQIKINALNIDKEKQNLSYEIIKSYLQLLEFSHFVKLYEINLKTKEIKFTQVEKKYELKQLNKIDFLEAQIELNQAKADLLNQQNQLKIAKQSLTNLTSIKNFNLPNIDFDKINITNLLKLLDENYLNNLDLQISKLTLLVSEKQLDYTHLEHYPKLDLIFSYSKYYTNDLTVDYDDDRYIGLELKIPIYQGGFVKSKSEQARLKIIAAQKNIDFTTQKINLSYQDLQTKFLAQLDSFNLYKQNKNATKLYLEAISKSYEHGLKSIVDVNEAKLKDFDTNQKMLQYFFKFFLYYVEILNLNSNLTIQNLELIDKNLGF